MPEGKVKSKTRSGITNRPGRGTIDIRRRRSDHHRGGEVNGRWLDIDRRWLHVNLLVDHGLWRRLVNHLLRSRLINHLLHRHMLDNHRSWLMHNHGCGLHVNRGWFERPG
jgi:hypothetical protein